MQYKLLTRVSYNKFSIQNCLERGSLIVIMRFGEPVNAFGFDPNMEGAAPSTSAMASPPFRCKPLTWICGSTTPDSDQGAAHRDMVTRYGAWWKTVYKEAK